MAAIEIPSPGTATGPCRRCKHIDCERSRKEASEKCCVCKKSIGYATPFYIVDENPTHARCFLVGHGSDS